MIYGRLWLVVRPTVGIPLFLGAVAVSSFAVHYMLLTHTTWMPKYYNGSAAVPAKAAKAATAEAVDTLAAAPSGATVAQAPRQ